MFRFQMQYGDRGTTALPYAMNSEFSRVLAAQMVSKLIKLTMYRGITALWYGRKSESWVDFIFEVIFTKLTQLSSAQLGSALPSSKSATSATAKPSISSGPTPLSSNSAQLQLGSVPTRFSTNSAQLQLVSALIQLGSNSSQLQLSSA